MTRVKVKCMDKALAKDKKVKAWLKKVSKEMTKIANSESFKNKMNQAYMDGIVYGRWEMKRFWDKE